MSLNQGPEVTFIGYTFLCIQLIVYLATWYYFIILYPGPFI